MGSVSTNEFKSGVKILIDEALGLEAHVTTRDSLNPKLRERIERQAVRVF